MTASPSTLPRVLELIAVALAVTGLVTVLTGSAGALVATETTDSDAVHAPLPDPVTLENVTLENATDADSTDRYTTQPADETTESTEETTDSTDGATNSTTEKVTETMASDSDSLAEAHDSTTDSVESGVGSTRDGATDAVNESTETVSNATAPGLGTVSEGVDGRTDVLQSATEELSVLEATTETRLGPVDADLAVDEGFREDPTIEGESSIQPRSTTDSAEGTAGSSGTTSTPEAGTGDASATANAVTKRPPSGGSAPLSTGTVALGAILFAVAGRQCVVLAQVPPRYAVGLFRSGSGAIASPFGERLRDWGGRFFAAIGYERYEDDDPLEHDSRRAILDHLEATPGTYLSAISRETGIPLATVRYHLKILEFEDLVVRTKVRGKRRYWPVGTEPSELDAALDDDGAGAVLKTLASGGPASVSGLAERLDRDVSTVTYHLQNLADDGLVEREQDGPAVINRLPQPVRKAIASAD